MTADVHRPSEDEARLLFSEVRMIEVITTSPHEYAQQQRAVGERYAAEEKFVPVLQHMGWARIAPAKRVNGKKHRSGRASV